jgi:hypothetical protein
MAAKLIALAITLIIATFIIVSLVDHARYWISMMTD